MPIYHITRSVLERIAQAISILRSFHDDAIYSEEAATAGQLKGRVIHNPAGPDTADITLHFPGACDRFPIEFDTQILGDLV